MKSRISLLACWILAVALSGCTGANAARRGADELPDAPDRFVRMETPGPGSGNAQSDEPPPPPPPPPPNGAAPDSDGVSKSTPDDSEAERAQAEAEARAAQERERQSAAQMQRTSGSEQRARQVEQRRERQAESQRERQVARATTSSASQQQSSEAEAQLAAALERELALQEQLGPQKSAMAAEHRASSSAPAPPDPPKASKSGAYKVIRLDEVAVMGKPVKRFPTMEAPSEVAPGTAFAVQVSLTELQLSPDVQIRSGKISEDGRLELNLSEKAEDQTWQLQVALSAPGFEVIGGQNLQTIALPDAGDSAPALFQLRARPVSVPRLQTELYATFWEKGRFLAKVAKPIAILGPTDAPAVATRAVPVVSASATAPPPTQPTQPAKVQAAGATLAFDAPPPDLTLWVLEGLDPTQPDAMQILVQSPHLQPAMATQAMPQDLDAWLLTQYGRFAWLANAVMTDKTVNKDANIAMLHGFGRELYRRFAPPAFKTALTELQRKLGGNFKTIQIFTNSPRLPWELMIAPLAGTDKETDFLGIQYQVARWHISNDQNVLARPAAALAFDRLMVVAPDYQGALKLPAQVAEVATLKRLARKHFQAVPGTLDGVGGLLAGKNGAVAGIVHFAGHGEVQRSEQHTPSFTIQLANTALNLMTWKGLSGHWGGAHPLIFLNACDVGRAERVAGFVDGWGPAMLETGASGYVGGLWPLGDRGAADFAKRFYGAGLPDGSRISVADAVRQARIGFYETGDPTYLAYVFYGDTALVLSAGAGPD